MLISACPLFLGTFSSAESKLCSTLYDLQFTPKYSEHFMIGKYGSQHTNFVSQVQSFIPTQSPLEKEVLHKSGSFYITRLRDFFFVADPGQFFSNSSEEPEKKLCFLKAGSCISSKRIKQRVLFYISHGTAQT